MLYPLKRSGDVNETLSTPQRVRGVKVLKAVSSPLRLQILSFFFDKGQLSYTELMNVLKMSPSRDAGRFAYHLKFLLKADLVEADVETKKYCLTELGKMVIDVADRIEKRASKQKGLLVRTSRPALEEFDANKIANSLIREAKMPAEQAQKVAKEAERELLKSKTKYLTASLVRELVNAILVEKGLEEYRHKLTRLGLPVHEVTALIEAKSGTPQGSKTIFESAGESVLTEYMLLNVLPRDVADAHLSGSLHIDGLSSWILKTDEVMHDLRFFFQNGSNLEKTSPRQPVYPPPQSLESALFMISNVLLCSAKEVNRNQTLDYFNVFFAPFIKGLETSKVKEILRLFLLNIQQNANVILGLELTIPDFVAKKPAVGLYGKTAGKYGDFGEESQLLASLVIDVFAEESVHKPMLNPKIVLKIRSETFADERAKAILLKAHALASERGILYFAKLLDKDHKYSAFSASGFRLKADLSGDWEVDTLRTGCLGCVAVNLPRITYESEKDKTKFFAILKERLEMATRALSIKNRNLKQNGKNALPFLAQDANDDQYLRLENCANILNMVGFREAVEAFSARSIDDKDSWTFAEQVLESVAAFVQKTGKKHGRRLYVGVLPCSEASERLVQLDIEKYGIAKVRFSGTRERPFYSTASKLELQNGKISPETLATQRKLAELYADGNLTIIELGEAEYKPDELLALTKQLIEESSVEFFTYNRKLTYCANCRNSWFGSLHKCPSCGAVGTLTLFN